MPIEIKVPSVGESVTEALLAQWFKNDGDTVKKDEPLFVIETDKVTLEVVAEADGVLSIKIAEGETVAIDAIVGTLDTEAGEKEAEAPAVSEAEKAGPAPAEPAEPKEPPPEPEMPPAVAGKTLEAEGGGPSDKPEVSTRRPGGEEQLAPSVRRLIAEKKLDPDQIEGTGPGGRITKGDVLLYIESGQARIPAGTPSKETVPGA